MREVGHLAGVPPLEVLFHRLHDIQLGCGKERRIGLLCRQNLLSHVFFDELNGALRREGGEVAGEAVRSRAKRHMHIAGPSYGHGVLLEVFEVGIEQEFVQLGLPNPAFAEVEYCVQ